MSTRMLHRSLATAALGLLLAACSTSGSTSSPATASPEPVPSATRAPAPAPVVVAAASLEPVLKELWQAAGPKPAKSGVCCPTIAPDGKIWVSAGFDSTFWIIDANGTYLESWGEEGEGDGQFRFAVKADNWGAIAFDPDGTFYVADTGNNRIQKFDKNRKFVMAWGEFGTEDGQLTSPIDIASDGRGQIYVLDNNRGDVQVFSPDGKYIRTLVTGLQNYFIDIDPDGRLYLDNGPEILVFDTNGAQRPGFDVSAMGGLAAGLAFDTAGHVYISTVNTYGPSKVDPIALYEIDLAGKVVHAWPGQADSLVLDPLGGAIYSSFYRDPFVRKLELPKP